MSESKWTKGPWNLGDENNSAAEVLLGTEHNLTAIFNRQDNNTGKFVIKREEMIANVHLTIAAPELYDALEQAEIALINCTPIHWSPGQEFGGYEHFNLLHVIRVALAKARGESTEGVQQ